MAVEHCRIIALEPDHIWVDMIQQSSCQACSARKGCGQGSLAEVLGGKRTQMQVAISDSQYKNLAIGQWVDIEVSESAIILGALWVYLMPLLLMIFSALIVAAISPGQVTGAIGAVIGFIIAITAVLFTW